MNTDSRKHVIFFIFLFFLGLYFLTTSGSVHVTVDGTVRYAVTKNMVDSCSVSIPEELGRDNGVVGKTGKYYTWYGIGQSAFMIPFYVIGKALGIPEFIAALFNPVISAITCVVIFLFCVNLGYSNRTSATIALIYGLGTTAWPQSKGPFEHPLETVLILLSIFLVHLHVGNRSYPKLILSAVTLGVAYITRVPTLLTVIPVLAYLFISHIGRKTLPAFFKEALIYGMTLVPFGAFSLCYNYARFGDVFETGYSMIFDQWGIEPFSTPWYVGVCGLILSPGKGFFLYSPIAILFILVVRAFYRKNKGLTIAFFTLIGVYVLFNCKYYVWHGDWAWGPRLLAVLTPFLIIPLGELFERGTWKRSLRIKALVIALLAVSISIQIAAVTVNLNRYFIKNHHTSRNLPNSIYFDPRHSPIKDQFKYVVEIAKKLRYYTPPVMHPDAVDEEFINDQITINIPDFWPVYSIYSGMPKWAFVVIVFILVAWTAISFFMIFKHAPHEIPLPLQDPTNDEELLLNSNNLDRGAA